MRHARVHARLADDHAAVGVPDEHDLAGDRVERAAHVRRRRRAASRSACETDGRSTATDRHGPPRRAGAAPAPNTTRRARRRARARRCASPRGPRGRSRSWARCLAHRAVRCHDVIGCRSRRAARRRRRDRTPPASGRCSTGSSQARNKQRSPWLLVVAVALFLVFTVRRGAQPAPDRAAGPLGAGAARRARVRAVHRPC